MSKYDEFQVLDDSPLILSGIEAEHVTDSYVHEGIASMGKYVVFDLDGLRWQVHAVYGADYEDELNIVFNLLVETFKILD